MKLFLITIGLLLFITAYTQNKNNTEFSRYTSNFKDTTHIVAAFKNGSLKGQARFITMATDNAKDLADYYATALGVGLKYETAPFKKWQFGISDYGIFNICSSTLTAPDAKPNQASRYEIGLFDITQPEKKVLNRLEELYLKYTSNRSKIVVGNQLINTPFINQQDGRIRPTAVEGVWTESEVGNHTKLEGGLLYRISPRSTTRWYTIGQSVGLYSQGVTVDGSSSNYAHNLKSKGIALAGVTRQVKNMKLQVWEQFADNLFNTALLQTEYRIKLSDSSRIYSGVQFIYQNAINNGGNRDPDKTYFKKGGAAFVISTQVGWQKKQWETNVSYTRITANGRYLMPREWGRDPFYTFMIRERNEGYGDVHATTLKLAYTPKKPMIKPSLTIGYFHLPSVTNFALNKYGMPSYTQVNADIRYSFEQRWKGLEAQLLYVYKGRIGPTYDNDKYVANKVNVSLYNIILNYTF